MQAKKPPMGIMPQWLHNESRAGALRGAIKRYQIAKKEAPQEWQNELNNLNKKIQAHRAQNPRKAP